MTHRLYYTDAALAEFSATLVDVGDDGRRAYLDATAFYPTSGGQPHDTGTLGGVRVIDVVDEGDRIAHVLAEPLPLGASGAIAGAIAGAIDVARRRDHMQQHTGQHLLSAVFADLLGAETTSVHFGPDVSTLDLDVAVPARDALLAVEARANALVADDVPVTVSFEDAATATGLRKPTDRAGTIRIVAIEGLDRSACGGTHVRSTAGIGAILLRRVERVRQTARVEFVCGLRAVRRARADYDALAEVAATFSAGVDQVPTLVRAQADSARGEYARAERLERELAAARAPAMVAAAAPDLRGARWVVQRTDGAVDALKTLALAVAEQPAAVFVALASDPAAVLVAAAPDSGVDAGAALKTALATVGGKGGGSARLAQGRVPNAAALEAVLAVLQGAPI